LYAALTDGWIPHTTKLNRFTTLENNLKF
jgi:hypothetical protein